MRSKREIKVSKNELYPQKKEDDNQEKRVQKEAVMSTKFNMHIIMSFFD